MTKIGIPGEMTFNVEKGKDYQAKPGDCYWFEWDQDMNATIATCTISDNLYSCPCYDHIEETGEPYGCQKYVSKERIKEEARALAERAMRKDGSE